MHRILPALLPLVLLVLLNPGGHGGRARADRTVRFQGAGAGKAGEKPLLVLNAGGHIGRIRGLFFTPDGKELVSVGEDRTVRVWGVGDGEARHVLHLPVGPEDHATDLGLAAALSPDGKTVAVGTSAPGTGQHWVYLINLAGERVERVLKVGKHPLWAVAFAPDGKLLATGGEQRTVLLWDLETGKVKSELSGHTGELRCLAFSPDGKLLASAGHDKTVRLWSVETGKARGQPLHGHTEHVLGLAWSPDGKTLASSAPGHVILRDPDDTRRRPFHGKFAGVGVAFSGDSKRLLVGDTLLDAANGTVKVRFREETDAETGGEPRERNMATALTPDLKAAAWAGVDELFLWSPEGKGRVKHELFRKGRLKHELFRLNGGGRALLNVAWSPDGKLLAWNRDAEGKGRTFNLTSLAFGEPSDKTFIGPRSTVGPVSLEHTKGKPKLVLKRDGKADVTLAFNKSPTCWTLLGEGQVVVGTVTALHRYDTGSGKQLHKVAVGNQHGVAPSPDNELFVTGGSDQTFRVWSPKSDHPLLSLFVAGAEWIAWTPQGYYAASPGGERLMGWLVNNGPDQLATFHPASRFRKSLYRPDVIDRVLKERDVGRAVALANKEAKGRGATAEDVLDITQVLPPAVRITSPAKAVLTVDREKLDVTAVAESVGDHPVLSLQLLLDGRPYGGAEGVRNFEPAKPGKVEATWTVTLTPGKHTLTVLAKSKPSNSAATPVQVTYDAAPPSTGPGLYVLAIGINEYRSPDLRLSIAVNDAQEVAETFHKKGTGLFGEVKVRVLTDKQATRQGIRDGLEWLRKNQKPHDLAVIFFSAHGCVGDDRKLYILASDTDEDQLEATALSGKELTRQVSGMPGRVLVLLSDCHAGATPGTAKPSRGELARDLADDDCGALVICAALNSELSLGSTEKKHSFFTLALIEALRGGPEGSPGEADYNKDGFISSTELFLYTQLRVNKLTYGRQTPTMTCPPLAPILVSRP
jgi:WD40 repeat protein